MTSDKKNISLLADLFEKSGLKNIVISPGSRNAPVILSFANNPKFNCHSIIDERSAAFFALGIALQTGEACAISCTSGSAVLNYSSAISEAYHQKIPLLVITADRPEHLIDVGDGQTIRQKKVFKNFVKKSFSLPENIDDPILFAKAESKINKALHYCMYPESGPVHINVPFDEPLYNSTTEITSGKLISFSKPVIPENLFIESISKNINTGKKVMIIAGQNKPVEKLNNIITKFSLLKNIIVLTETTSNLQGNSLIDTIDNVVTAIPHDAINNFKPDILLSINGQVVSKIVKKFLRKAKPDSHFHISPSGEEMDTYSCLTAALTGCPVDILNKIYKSISPTESNYANNWLSLKKKVDIRRKEYLQSLEYSDLKVFNHILNNLPEQTVLHLGNSTPVRYSQLFGNIKGIVYQSNRGVSGIDGQVSTAAGYALFSEKQNLLITGDLGFLYDSNGLMNHYLGDNFRIIVINNQGGGIFRFIPGPDTTNNLEQFFEAKHNWNAKHICKAFNVEYTAADNTNYQKQIDEFINTNLKGPQLLEVFTPSYKNGILLRNYFEYIKNK